MYTYNLAARLLLGVCVYVAGDDASSCNLVRFVRLDVICIRVDPECQDVATLIS